LIFIKKTNKKTIYMVLTIKNRLSYYKRYEMDIWGVMRTHNTNYIFRKHKEMPFLPFGKINNIIIFFYNIYLKKKQNIIKKYRRYIYRLDIIDKPIKKNKLKHRFVSLRLLKLFYINITYRQFRNLAFKMRRKAGNFEENYLMTLECRLLSVLYRTSLIPNPFQCIQLIRQGYVLINLKNVWNINSKIDINCLLNFVPMFKKYIYINLIKRLLKKRTLFNPPTYMFVSYVFLFSYMNRPPRRKDLIYPISLDIYRASGYVL